MLINIDISQQNLKLIHNNQVIHIFKVSTSKYGVGQLENSYQTPTGKHIIIEKFGENAPLNTIFSSRIPSGLYMNKTTNSDLILTRILRLSGIETGVNKGENIDTYERYIYIHGTCHEYKIGIPDSIGCIRMFGNDIITLYNNVEIGCEVNIHE